MDLKQIIASVHQQGGTEIHLKVGSPPLVRHNKYLKRMTGEILQKVDLDSIADVMLASDEKRKFGEQRFFEGNFFGQPPCNFRLNLFYAQSQICAIIRIIGKAVPKFSEIGFPESLASITTANTGLFILAGPARSGISTSLAAFIERINQSRAAHILIIEDPIEFYFEPQKSRISQRQFKKDLLSIEQGINFSKRMDVDVLVIGDLKREIPYTSVLDYVDGGHFVIITMQTLGVQNTLEKIILSFPEADREHIWNVLAHNLLGICSQVLLVDPFDQRMLPIHEVLLLNNSMRSTIQKGRISQIDPNLKTVGENNQSFEQDILRVLREGRLTKEITDSFMSMYKGLRNG